MQATVRSFDRATGSGTVFLDDGTVCPFGARAFALSGLRLLRAGQRVSIRVGRDGEITAVTLPTLPLSGEDGPGPPGSRRARTAPGPPGSRQVRPAPGPPAEAGT